ncbi:MAG TPA: hypothetical protein VNP97_10765 [Microbacterium sp.]|nr:hypothetical protein [Microbacterium sp.]
MFNAWAPRMTNIPRLGQHADVAPELRTELVKKERDVVDEDWAGGVRPRNEVQLGFKLVEWIKGIEFVEHFSEVGGGHGGCNNDHEFFGYRQSI